MAWKIELEPAAERDLDRIAPQAAMRILKFLHQRVANLDNARAIGEALQGPDWSKFWRYRVGEYRVIARIEDARVCVLVVKVGHRGDVYR